MVVISEPFASTAKTKHELTILPSIITVQAPHSPSAQTSLAPVKFNSLRKKSSSREWVGIDWEIRLLFTVNSIVLIVGLSVSSIIIFVCFYRRKLEILPMLRAEL